MGLLDDDTEYIEAIKEAAHEGSSDYLRNLFATMFTSNSLSRPDIVWESTWQGLSDDILRKRRKVLNCPDLTLSEDQLKNLALLGIENFLLRNSSTLRNFIEEQKNVYNTIMKAVEDKKGGVFFVYGYEGTGTFLWKTLSSSIRSKIKIVLNVASSGIASLLLSGCRTTHSRFLIPINLTEDSLCYIKPDSDVGHLLKKTDLIIWDEAPMVHKHAFVALDRTLKDISGLDNLNNSELLFGGKVLVFGGDFRQILLVVPNGSRHDIVSASLSSSYIWHECKVLKLTKNMRLIFGIGTGDFEETNNFVKWLLDIGDRNVGSVNGDQNLIEIPDDLLITQSLDPVSNLISFVYPSILENISIPNHFQERAILAPKNEVVQDINDRLLAMFPGDETEYLSSDTICQSDDVNEHVDESLYSPDVLNGLKFYGIPNHKLVLKVGVPVMLLRNIDKKKWIMQRNKTTSC